MNQQEAYQLVKQHIESIKAIHTQINQLQREFGLIVEVMDRDGTLSAIDPQFMADRYNFKKWEDMTEEQQLGFASFLDVDLEEAEGYYAGKDIYNCWVPSQFC